MSESLHEMINRVFHEKADQMANSGMTSDEIIEALTGKIDSAFDSICESASNVTLEYMKDHMYEAHFLSEQEDAEFIAHHNMIWGECFAASKTMYVLTLEAADLHRQYVEANACKEDYTPSQYTYLTLQHLHGRACQEFLEILELMKGGFADGAYARWRSMYELCCIAQFIVDNGEAIAKQYFEQSETDIQRYDWTKGVLDKERKPIKYFSQIQEMCDVDSAWKEQYKLGCIVTHASPQGTFKRLSNATTENLIPAGRSDYGLTTPAEHSALSLQWITSLYLGLFPTLDSLTHARFLMKWSEYLRELYFTTRDQAFDENDAEDDEANDATEKTGQTNTIVPID